MNKKQIFLFITIIFLMYLGLSAPSPGFTLSTSGEEVPVKWQCGVFDNNLNCAKSGDVNGHVPSPALADLNNDGKLDIIVATAQGRIVAIKDNGSSGSKLWSVDIATLMGMSAGSQVIESTPAVADIDEDGRPEIVVGYGKSHSSICRPGGVLVLEHTGALKSGWPKAAFDNNISPAGCPDPIYGTPALGDLDNDGDLEIVVGGFDKRVYAWHHNGNLLNGFPIDSNLKFRFPDWGLSGTLADTIWSSPTLADMDGDGYLDIVIGSDEGNFDQRWGGDAGGWTCPYSMPATWTQGYCGGSLYVIDRFGNPLPGYPKYVLEHIQSTPALYDVNNDGHPEIFVGTGTWYNNTSPDGPLASSNKIFAWDYQGNDLPGWEGGKSTGGPMPASPAIGDIDGDGDVEIVALSMNREVYAWHHTGTAVSGFPMTPRDFTTASYEYNVGRSLALADFDGNGSMELFITTGWSVTIVNGSGSQLTTSSGWPYNADLYFADGSLRNTPALGDIDGDGELEMVTSNSNVTVWDLPGSGDADWPMFKRDPARTGYFGRPILQVNPTDITLLVEQGDGAPKNINLSIRNIGVGSIDWSLNLPANVTASATNGTLSDETIVTLTAAPGVLPLGTYNLGDVTITATTEGQPVALSPQSVSLTFIVVDQIYNVYLPTIQR